MANATLTAVEAALAPVAVPLLNSLWSGTIAPAIQKELQSGSPEIQVLETAIMQLLNQVVPAELAKL